MIIKLPQSIANQIAAGEVVERPSSVVKELVENSIDSGARNIVLEIANAGKDMISIRDDGCGIEESDLPLVFERNATSKIKSIEDVYNVMSLGFRGEALASISSVSKIVLISRHQDSPLGKKIIFYNDEIKESQDLAASKGTTITVSDLFYNTPARYKFLKSNASEKASIMSIMTNMALSYPDISFSVINDDREEFRTTGRGDLEEVIKLLFERDFAKALIPVESEQNDIKISGFIANPQYTRGNRSRQFIFVNGRIVHSKLVNRAIENAYEGMLMKRRYPAYVIKLDLPVNMIDVNIHPQKLEVKFDREDMVESLLYNAVRNALVNRRISRQADLNRISSYDSSLDSSSYENVASEEKADFDLAGEEEIVDSYGMGDSDETLELAKMLSEDSEEFMEDRKERYEDSDDEEFIESNEESLSSNTISKGALNWVSSYSYEKEMPSENSNASNSQIQKKEFKPKSIENIEEYYLREMLNSKKSYGEEYSTDVNYDDFKLIGQVLNTFLVCECGTSVYYIDQHAAHERVLFERFYKEFKEKRVENQMLLEPIEYVANLAELDSVEKAIDFLISLDVEIERVDEKTWLIKSVPVFRDPIDADELVDIIDKYAYDRGETYHRYFIDKIIMQSCKSAIKSGDVLNHIQMQDLINMLKKCENPHSCPHGRPSTIEMKRSDFDKLFKRIV